MSYDQASTQKRNGTQLRLIIGEVETPIVFVNALPGTRPIGNLRRSLSKFASKRSCSRALFNLPFPAQHLNAEEVVQGPDFVRMSNGLTFEA